MHPWCILEETPCLRSWVHHPNLYDPPQQPSASPCVLSPPTSPEPPGSHAAVASIERHDKQPPLVKQNNGAYEAMWPLSTSIWCMNLPQGWLKVDKLSVCILEICFFWQEKPQKWCINCMYWNLCLSIFCGPEIHWLPSKLQKYHGTTRDFRGGVSLILILAYWTYVYIRYVDRSEWIETLPSMNSQLKCNSFIVSSGKNSTICLFNMIHFQLKKTFQDTIFCHTHYYCNTSIVQANLSWWFHNLHPTTSWIMSSRKGKE